MLIERKQPSAICAALQSEGYEVTSCQAPQKAWGLVFRDPPDLVIVRLESLSDKDPVTVQECGALATGTPVIVATSFPGHEALIKNFVQGDGSYIYVPDNGRTIVEALNKLRPTPNE